MGNWIAYAAIGLWPILAILMYKIRPVTVATFWTIVGGHMFLPVGTSVDLPMIPPLGKESIPALAALVGCWIIKGKQIPVLGKKGLVRWLLLLFMVEPFMTAELNGMPFFVGGLQLPGMTHYDALSAVINQFIVMIPLFIGRQIFRTYDSQLLLFKMLVIAGLWYSLLILFEIRMSPQLHTWIYGYFPHSFDQMMRYGGFRPVVFMGHGLLVSLYVAVILLAAVVLWQLKVKVRQFSSAKVTYYLLFVLVLCKSTSSVLYGFLGLLLTKLTRIKTQMRVAVILVSIALLYPTISAMNLFPYQAVLEFVGSIEADRARSMGVRFENEQRIIEHGRTKFFFGWGTWGRNRIYDEETGKDETITDGRWVITFSQFGWLGFIGEFGLLATPIFMAYAVSKKIKSQQELILLAAHALIISLITIDQLPNASLAPWLWLLTGSLLGRCDEISKLIRQKAI